MTGGLFLYVSSSPPVENRQLTLNLQTENKGSVVSGGELTIFLDGPAVDLGSLPNGSAVTEGECRPAPRACSSSVHEAVSSGGERSGADSTAPSTPEQTSECRQPPAPPGKALALLQAPVGADVRWDTGTGVSMASCLPPLNVQAVQPLP